MRLESIANIKIFTEKIGTDHDNILNLLVEDVSSRIEHFLNRKLTKQEYTEYFNVDQTRKYFYIKAFPIDLTETFTVEHFNSERNINSDYFVWEESGKIEFEVPVPRCSQPKCIKVIYTGGYEEQYINGEDILNVPRDLKRACLIQTSFEYKRRRDLGLNNVTLPDGSFGKTFTAELLTEVKKILKTYRRNAQIR